VLKQEVFVSVLFCWILSMNPVWFGVNELIKWANDCWEMGVSFLTCIVHIFIKFIRVRYYFHFSLPFVYFCPVNGVVCAFHSQTLSLMPLFTSKNDVTETTATIIAWWKKTYQCSYAANFLYKDYKLPRLHLYVPCCQLHTCIRARAHLPEESWRYICILPSSSRSTKFSGKKND
jgi:hypothetical protein